MQKHPLPDFSPDFNSPFNRSKPIKFFVMTYTVLRGMINFTLLCLLGTLLSFFITWQFEVSDNGFLLIAFIVISLIFYVAYSITKNLRFLRMTPLKCSNCGKFMETNEYEVPQYKGEDYIFFECPKCKLYVDSGIRNGG